MEKKETIERKKEKKEKSPEYDVAI